jgi:hypothetical protein
VCFWRRLQYALRLVLFLLRLRVEEAVQNGVALTVAPAGLRLQWARRASISVLRPVKLKRRAKSLNRFATETSRLCDHSVWSRLGCAGSGRRWFPKCRKRYRAVCRLARWLERLRDSLGFQRPASNILRVDEF